MMLYVLVTTMIKEIKNCLNFNQKISIYIYKNSNNYVEYKKAVS